MAEKGIIFPCRNTRPGINADRHISSRPRSRPAQNLTINPAIVIDLENRYVAIQ
jgi:hypothetical protein